MNKCDVRTIQRHDFHTMLVETVCCQVRYIPPHKGTVHRRSQVPINPARDVQTLATFSCKDPLLEPSGITKGLRPLQPENITLFTTTTSPR